MDSIASLQNDKLEENASPLSWRISKMASIKNKLNHIFIAAIASAALVGCGDDSSTNPGSQSGERGAFRVARPAVYETKGGINYFTYYWGKCTITNGQYNWDPKGSTDRSAYIISKDTLKVYYRSTEEYEHDTPLDENVNYFMYGGNNNNSIFGNWDAVHCGIRDGQYKCGTQEINGSYEFKQDSVITYMTIDPNFNLINSFLHTFFHDYFSFCTDDYDTDEKGNLKDIPERGISFSFQSNKTATVTIQGQVVKIDVDAYTETNAIHSFYSISSNGKKCSADGRFGYVNKAEYCSEAYKDYLTNDNLDYKGSDISTYYLRDKGNYEEYSNCIKSLFENNPAYNPEEQ